MNKENFDNHLPSEKEIGGKARNLLILKKEGFNIPDFFVIPYTNLENIELKEIVKNITYKTQHFKKDFILRSSATGEDSKDNSFAGIFESIRIKDVFNLNTGLKNILKSLDSEKLSFYIQLKKIKENIRIN